MQAVRSMRTLRSTNHPTMTPPSWFFFDDPAPAEIYTLSLHDALPISCPRRSRGRRRLGPGTGSCSPTGTRDRKSTRLNSSHTVISYAVFCLKKKTNKNSAPANLATVGLPVSFNLWERLEWPVPDNLYA